MLKAALKTAMVICTARHPVEGVSENVDPLCRVESCRSMSLFGRSLCSNVDSVIVEIKVIKKIRID